MVRRRRRRRFSIRRHYRYFAKACILLFCLPSIFTATPNAAGGAKWYWD